MNAILNIFSKIIINYKTRLYALSMKNNQDIRNYIIFDKGQLKYKETIFLDLNKHKNSLILNFIEIKNNLLQIEGKDNFGFKREKYCFFCKIGNEIILPEYKAFKLFNFKIMFVNIINGRIVKFNIPIKNEYLNKAITFYLSYMNNTLKIKPSYGLYAHIPPINNSYYCNENFILTYINSSFNLISNTQINRNNLEEKYTKEFKKFDKKELIKLRKKAIKYREKGNKKNIWILNDGSNKAGNNGEYFFRYLINKNPCDIEFYFVIKKNCSDYMRLLPLGHILTLGSKAYNTTFLKANKIISSSANKWVNNPFGSDRKYLIDLFHFDLVFLQNGITKDDISNYINRFAINFSLIMTASKYEYNSFLSKDYGYSYNNIKLTGLSRFDHFPKEENMDKTEKKIIIIPTLRLYIKGNVDKITYESIYSEIFIKTDYFKFYNSLINSPILLEIMERYNYTGIFCLHPSYIEQWKDFKNNSVFSIKKSFEYPNLLINSSLLITDYSSIFFDFSYIKKPIIYAHFDYEKYRNLQYQKGYFDYRLNGFGPVCIDLENCIETIVNTIKTGCKLEIKYLKGIKKFFRFFDNHNNDRIYNAIRNSPYDDEINKNQRIKDIYIFVIIVIINCICISNKSINIIFMYKN